MADVKTMAERVTPGKYAVVRAAPSQNVGNYTARAQACGLTGLIFRVNNPAQLMTEWLPNADGADWQQLQQLLSTGLDAILSTGLKVGLLFEGTRGAYEVPLSEGASYAGVLRILDPTGTKLDFYMVDITGDARWAELDSPDVDTAPYGSSAKKLCHLVSSARWAAVGRPRPLYLVTPDVPLETWPGVMWDGRGALSPPPISVVTGGDFLYGVAVNADTSRMYVTDETGSKVYVVDLGTSGVIAEIAVGASPLGVAVNAWTNRIYVANDGDGTVTVIDGESNTVIATITVGVALCYPSFVAVNPYTDRIYVTLANNTVNKVVVIDGGTNAVVASITVGNTPQGIAINPYISKAYVANMGANTVSVIDLNSGTVEATIPVGSYPNGAAVNPFNDRVYITNEADGTVSVLDGDSDTVIDTVAVGNSPEGVAVDPTVDLIYVVNMGDDTMSIINGTAGAVVDTKATGHWPVAVVVNTDSGCVYAANLGDGTVSVFCRSATQRVLAPGYEWSCLPIFAAAHRVNPSDGTDGITTAWSWHTTIDTWEQFRGENIFDLRAGAVDGATLEGLISYVVDGFDISLTSGEYTCTWHPTCGLVVIDDLDAIFAQGLQGSVAAAAAPNSFWNLTPTDCGLSYCGIGLILWPLEQPVLAPIPGGPWKLTLAMENWHDTGIGGNLRVYKPSIDPGVLDTSCPDYGPCDAPWLFGPDACPYGYVDLGYEMENVVDPLTGIEYWTAALSTAAVELPATVYSLLIRVDCGED
jgi:YVTN family beta-propeller protein